MGRTGIHHIGLAGTDYEGTIDFYTNILKLPVAVRDITFDDDGVVLMRHVFFEVGGGQMLAFMFPTEVKQAKLGLNYPWATDINSGLGVEGVTYHFAFSLESLEELEEKRQELRSLGCDVTRCVDHGWCSSIYFRDPNGLLLEFCVTSRELTEDDSALTPIYRVGTNERPAGVFADYDREILYRPGVPATSAVSAQ